MQEAKLHDHEMVTRRRLETLGELTEALSKALTLADVVDIVLDLGMKAAVADSCTLYSFDEEARALTLVGHRGVNPELIDRLTRITAESGNPAFFTLESGRILFAESPRDYEVLFPELAKQKTDGPRAQAFWSVPVIAESKPIGLLGMGFYSPRPFPPEERNFVQTFTRHCAEALRRAELLAREREARMAAERLQRWFATTLRSIGDAVISTDTEGRVTLMNPVAERLTGWTEAEARQRPLREVFAVVSEDTRQELESPVERVLREGPVIGLANHTLLLSRDRTRETPIEDSAAPIRTANANVEGIVLVFRDATVQRREELRRSFLAQAAAVLSESLDYETTLARVAALVVPVLADWCTVDVADENSTRTKRVAVAHVDPAKLAFAHEIATKYPPNPDATSGVPNVLRTGRPELYPDISDELLVASAPDEEYLRILRELRLRSAMLVPLTARGRVLGVMTFVYADAHRHYTEDDLRFAELVAQRCAIAIDNARLFAAERRAHQSADIANHAKDEFLVTVSHELKTPLTAILSWAKLLCAPGTNEVRRKHAVETIERNAGAMTQLVDELLDMSSLVSGRIDLQTQPVELCNTIDSVIDSIRAASEAKQIRVDRTFDADAVLVTGDPARMRQIIWNLVANAVKFTNPGGRVSVTLRRDESSAQITVKDSGKGIEPAFMPYLFDPFRQEVLATARARGGLGLGLAITRRLVELHGGTIEANSDGPGRGSAFTITLPLGSGDVRATSERPSS